MAALCLAARVRAANSLRRASLRRIVSTPMPAKIPAAPVLIFQLSWAPAELFEEPLVDDEAAFAPLARKRGMSIQ